MFDLIKAIGDFGILIVLSGVAIFASSLMFKRLLESYDKLTPAILGLTRHLERLEKNEDDRKKENQKILAQLEIILEKLVNHQN